MHLPFQKIPAEVMLFTRARTASSELHSKACGRDRLRISSNVAILFQDGGRIETYYGSVNEYWLVQLREVTLRIAVVETFPMLPRTKWGTEKINTNRPYATGRLVPLQAIDRLVIFFQVGSHTRILEVAPHLSI